MTYRKNPPRLFGWLSSARRGLTRRAYRFEAAAAPSERQLLIDVSVIIKNDARTGIQRVVRALLAEFANMTAAGFVVQPVFATRNHGYCKAQLLPDGRITTASAKKRVLQPAATQKGDIFLGLDLCAHLLPHVETDLMRWRQDGVSINIMVYDLLPLLRPEWFPAKTVRNFKRWLGVVARQADRCIAISETVASALAAELAAQRPTSLLEITCIPLGANLDGSYPSKGLPENLDELIGWLQSRTAILAVGTIEPRKGHHQLMAAMSSYWQSEPSGEIALLIVGRRGWKTKALVRQINGHPEQGKRLIWLEDCSDELLSKLYQHAAGLVAVSHDEGFGLPLMEALAHGIPVLARDLPVFREIGASMFDYFEDDMPPAFCERLKSWLSEPQRALPQAIAGLPQWSDSAAVLATQLGMVSASERETAKR